MTEKEVGPGPRSDEGWLGARELYRSIEREVITDGYRIPLLRVLS